MGKDALENFKQVTDLVKYTLKKNTNSSVHYTSDIVESEPRRDGESEPKTIAMELLFISRQCISNFKQNVQKGTQRLLNELYYVKLSKSLLGDHLCKRS